MRRHLWVGVVFAAAIGLDRSAHGQTPETPPAQPPRLTVGAEVTINISPADNTAFFNYTDYAHNAIRLGLVQFVGEWRFSNTLSVLAEVRTENADDLDASALYLRWRPSLARNIDIQVGRIPPVFGAFARRAYGRDNLVIGDPLAYQYLVPLRPDALPASVDDLLRMRARGWEPIYPVGATTLATGVPLVTATQWGTGAEAHWQHAWLEAAGSWTLGAPADPLANGLRGGGQFSGRIGATPSPGFTIGASAARGPWIADSVWTTARTTSSSSRTENVVGADAEISRGQFVIRGEVLDATFHLPIVLGPPTGLTLSAWSGFVEGRYRFRPRWQAALRADTLQFSRA